MKSCTGKILKVDLTAGKMLCCKVDDNAQEQMKAVMEICRRYDLDADCFKR